MALDTHDVYSLTCPFLKSNPNNPSKPFRCCKRYCVDIECREAWAYRYWRLLHHAHSIESFTHRFAIHPPKKYSDSAKLLFVQNVRDAIKKWTKRNPNETFSFILFPDKHGKQPLHFNGVARLSANAKKYYDKMKVTVQHF